MRTNRIIPIRCVLILLLVSADLLWAGPRIKDFVNALVGWDKSSKEAHKSAEALQTANEKHMQIIRKEGLEVAAQKLGACSSDSSRQFEQALTEWLNGKEGIRQAGLRCVSVALQKEASDGYRGLATFDNGEQVHVEVNKEADSGELYFRADLPTVVVVSSDTLPGYEYTTIGKAFNAFFADPNWTTRTAENGTKFVEFTGRLKQDLLLIDLDDNPFSNLGDALRVANGITPSWAWKQGDQVCIRFAISHDGESFELWSVRRGEDHPIMPNDWERHTMIDKLFEAIYDLK